LNSASDKEENKSSQPVVADSSNTVWTGKTKRGAPYMTLVKGTDFRGDMKQVKNSSSSDDDYRVKMRQMMEKYTDAQVLEGLETLPIASYFSKFG